MEQVHLVLSRESNATGLAIAPVVPSLTLTKLWTKSISTRGVIAGNEANDKDGKALEASWRTSLMQKKAQEEIPVDLDRDCGDNEIEQRMRERQTPKTLATKIEGVVTNAARKY